MSVVTHRCLEYKKTKIRIEKTRTQTLYETIIGSGIVRFVLELKIENKKKNFFFVFTPQTE